MTRLSKSAIIAAGVLVVAGCSGSSSSSSAGAAPTPANSAPIDMSTTPPSPDPRVGLRPGRIDSAHKNFLVPAAQAIWNLQLVSHTPSSAQFAGVTNSDLAFVGNYVIQGSYDGYQVWDVSKPNAPLLKNAYLCPASQSDVSVYKNLLFVSSEAPSARLDCGGQGVPDTVSMERIRGIRVFDATDIAHPKYLTNVQTCRGSHTHTVVTDPNDKENIYIYISGTSSVRSPTEMPGCANTGADDPNTALFRIEVIKVPLAHPEQAAIVSHPRIFADASTGMAAGLASPRGHGAPPSDTGAAARAGRGGRGGLPAGLTPLTPTSTHDDSARTMAVIDSLKKAGSLPATFTLATLNAVRGGGRGPNPGAGKLTQCHDITVYPAVGLAGGACAGMGLLLDIRDPANPRRLDAASDSNFSFWHSATFSNDGAMVLFSDEWGGGGAAYCRATDPKDWGADAIFRIQDGKLTFQSYYKMPAAQTKFENCVAHNGSLIPIPGRTVMVQSWYQGGISVFDWTDPTRPHEIGFFDRGPMDTTGVRAVTGGYWSSYWYNGHIVGSEILRGMDIFDLKPSGFISQNEIDAAKLVRFDFLNVQDQPKFVWPANIAVPRALLDQLVRDNGISRTRSTAIAHDLDHAQAMKGRERKAAFGQLATRLDGDASAATDAAKVRLLSAAVRDLANARD